jgi:hypothetical protein
VEAREAATDSAVESIHIEVKSDPHFGPLIHATRSGKSPAVRITPLTENDVREIVEALEIPLECGLDELLGRVSQLIEELPWMCAMTARFYRVHQRPAPCRVVVADDVKLCFCHHEANELGIKN